jgi:hypothetical protein
MNWNVPKDGEVNGKVNGVLKKSEESEREGRRRDGWG